MQGSNPAAGADSASSTGHARCAPDQDRALLATSPAQQQSANRTDGTISLALLMCTSSRRWHLWRRALKPNNSLAWLRGNGGSAACWKKETQQADLSAHLFFAYCEESKLPGHGSPHLWGLQRHWRVSYAGAQHRSSLQLRASQGLQLL